MNSYKCKTCGYVYQPDRGDEKGATAPGTAFENLPETWTCPTCGRGKDRFKPV